MNKGQKVYLAFKRVIDVLGSIIGILFCFSLLWWWTFIVNLIITKGHPLFFQERYGKNKNIFKIIKFRTMKLDADSDLAPYDMDNETRKNSETKFGRFLRFTSIDETPQLINILLGHMSFIGPRPGAAHNEEYLVEAREKYNPSAFIVRPGISGLAQVKMKRDHNPELKAEYDHEYVKNISLWLDIKILFLTFACIFKRGK